MKLIIIVVVLNFILLPEMLSETNKDYNSPNIGVLKYIPAGKFQRDESPQKLCFFFLYEYL